MKPEALYVFGVLVGLVSLVVACQPRTIDPTATSSPTPVPTSTFTPMLLPRPTVMPDLTPHAPASGDEQAWAMIWADEFDVDGLPDPARWDYEEGYVRNNELQYYTRARPENARVEDGMLVIEARQEPYEEYGYTSASLVTRNRASWRYGRIEVRAKLPTGSGTWPAIWMLGMNIPEVGWPDCGEIDIMENVGFDPDRIYANVHTQAYNHVKKTNKGSNISVAKPYDGFHVYAIEWFEDHIDFFVDDDKYFSFQNEGTGWEAWPFDQEFYLIINLAIGGSWGGMHGVDEDIFPQQYHIDYVRVYQAIE